MPHATTSTSTAVATVEPVFTEPERLALAGFLAGYTGLTRQAYALDLRQYASMIRIVIADRRSACRAEPAGGSGAARSSGSSARCAWPVGGIQPAADVLPGMMNIPAGDAARACRWAR